LVLSISTRFLTQSGPYFCLMWSNHLNTLHLTTVPTSLTPIFSALLK
jgi:hypothetical protein